MFASIKFYLATLKFLLFVLYVNAYTYRSHLFSLLFSEHT